MLHAARARSAALEFLNTSSDSALIDMASGLPLLRETIVALGRGCFTLLASSANRFEPRSANAAYEVAPFLATSSRRG